MTEKRVDSTEALTRRDALSAIVGVGAALGFGCGTRANVTGASDAGADASSGSDGAASCTSTPEGEVGPYFADDSAAGFNRSSILSNLDGSGTQKGIPLTLNITVIDAEKGCTPYAGAQIDIWHCNASGVYSDIASENTSSEQWLRGYQITDTQGQVTFQTIVPGWYSGRTTHIHLRVRSSYGDASANDDGTNTTQLFFDQTLVDTFDTTVAPYRAEGKNPTTNAGDRVYAQEESGANVLALTGNSAQGYTAAVTIYLPIRMSYDGGAAGAMGAGPGDGGPPGAPGDGGPMPGPGEGGPPGDARSD